MCFLFDLKEFGLIYSKGDLNRFYPTRLALNMTSSYGAAGVEGEGTSQNPSENADGLSTKEGFLVVETNFRLYAYTNDMQLKIPSISLFAELEYFLPNLVVGTITRNSIRTALSNGITADQIIAYLKINAHAQMKSKTPILPQTVVEQIKLWEEEKNRISDSEVVLYDSFGSAESFSKLREYAENIGVLVWFNEEKRYLAIRPEGQEDVRLFAKQQHLE